MFVWDRREGESLADAFAREPCEAPAAIETQGEALALDLDGRGFITISEGVNSAVSAVASSGREGTE